MSTVFVREVFITLVDNWVVNFDDKTCKNIITGVEYKVLPYSMFRCIGYEKAVYCKDNSIMMLDLTSGVVTKYYTFITHPAFNKIEGKWYAVFEDKIMSFDGFVMKSDVSRYIRRFIGNYYVTLNIDNNATICIYKMHTNIKLITIQIRPSSVADVSFIKDSEKIVDGIIIIGQYIFANRRQYELVKVEGECPICYEDFNETTEITNTVCNHVFHTECLSKWVNNNNTCPMCRRSLR